MQAKVLALIVKDPWRSARLALHRVYEWRHPNEPWISPRAVRWCERNLTRDMKAIEWGSGRSTPWFAAHVGHLTSVEHDRAWYDIVKAKLTSSPNVDYRYVALDHPASEPTVPRYPQSPSYVAVADRFEDESVDFVVIDGHYRQACVLASLGKLKPGGFLLVDNSNWLSPAEWGVPASYPVVHESEYGRGATTVWRKPGS
jgi:SAM-dependent methyltransferase